MENNVFNKKIRFSRTIKFNPDVYEFRIKQTKVWGSNINVTQITILTAHHRSFVFIPYTSICSQDFLFAINYEK